MTSPPPRRNLRFGVFEADLEASELRKRGVRVRLPLQAFQVLQRLIEHPGRIVSREELQRTLWSADTFVEFDRGLNNAISRVRDVLDDSASSPRFIETIPRQGYRFIAAVEELPPRVLPSEPAPCPPSPEVEGTGLHPPTRRTLSLHLVAVAAVLTILIVVAAWAARSAPRPWQAGPAIHSIAVLPLTYTSAPEFADHSYLADGLTDALITELAKIRELRVISATSSGQYRITTKSAREIANELGVQAIVEGRVTRDGNVVRVNVQLIRANSDSHVWADSFTRGLINVVALQSDLALAVAREIGQQVTVRDRGRRAQMPPIAPEAYRLYVLGEQLRKTQTEADLYAALDHFQRALRLQPDYARAYLGMAESWITLSGWAAYLPPREGFPKAKAAAEKAIQLDSSLGEAHGALAFVTEAFDWNLPAADRLYQRALMLTPNDALTHARYSLHLARTRRLQDAVEHGQRSYELDPISLESQINYGTRLFSSGKVEDGIAALRRAVDTNPMHFHGWVHLGEVLVRVGKADEAVDAARRAVELSNQSAHAVHMLAHLHGRLGRKAEAEALIRPLEERRTGRNPYDIGMFHLSLGNRDKALVWLTRACDERTVQMAFFHIAQVARHFDPIRPDPRFQALVECGREGS